MSITSSINILKKYIEAKQVQLIAVSKTQSVEAIQVAYKAGQRVFAENIVQELLEKQVKLPKDIEWHFVGHLQSNKVKYLAPFVRLIQAVDSLKVLQEIDKQARKNQRIIDCLLQVRIAQEATKFGLNFSEVTALLQSNAFSKLHHIRIAGVMGIATHTDNQQQVRKEFHELRTLFQELQQSFFKTNPAFKEISMGMSSDYQIAIATGSTMVRIGSSIFGERVKVLEKSM